MRDESSFTRRVSEALSAVEMNTVSMRETRNFQEFERTRTLVQEVCYSRSMEVKQRETIMRERDIQNEWTMRRPMTNSSLEWCPIPLTFDERTA